MHKCAVENLTYDSVWRHDANIYNRSIVFKVQLFSDIRVFAVGDFLNLTVL